MEETRLVNGMTPSEFDEWQRKLSGYGQYEKKLDLEQFYNKTDLGGAQPIEYINEPVYGEDAIQRVTKMHIEDLPRHIKGRLHQSLQRSASDYANSLDHHIGALDGFQLLDKQTISQLKELRGQLNGIYDDDLEVSKQIDAVLDRLQLAKR